MYTIVAGDEQDPISNAALISADRAKTTRTEEKGSHLDSTGPGVVNENEKNKDDDIATDFTDRQSLLVQGEYPVQPPIIHAH